MSACAKARDSHRNVPSRVHTEIRLIRDVLRACHECFIAEEIYSGLPGLLGPLFVEAFQLAIAREKDRRRLRVRLQGERNTNGKFVSFCECLFFSAAQRDRMQIQTEHR